MEHENGDQDLIAKLKRKIKGLEIQLESSNMTLQEYKTRIEELTFDLNETSVFFEEDSQKVSSLTT